MPSDIFGWLMAIYWPACFLAAVGLTIAFVKKPITRELMAVGFGVLLAVVILQRVFWTFAFPGDGEMDVSFELMSASRVIFGLGDLVGYVFIFIALILPGRTLTRRPT